MVVVVGSVVVVVERVVVEPGRVLTEEVVVVECDDAATADTE